MKLVIIYVILALIATLANIGSQDIFIRVYSGKFSVLLSIIAGTGTGLVVKYVLDKRYIFQFKAQNAAHDTRTFGLYALMGILTTMIFWGFEFGFDHVFQTKGYRYLGGVIGLAIGYLSKYQLDKRFVFRSGVAA